MPASATCHVPKRVFHILGSIFRTVCTSAMYLAPIDESRRGALCGDIYTLTRDTCHEAPRVFTFLAFTSERAVRSGPGWHHSICFDVGQHMGPNASTRGTWHVSPRGSATCVFVFRALTFERRSWPGFHHSMHLGCGKL